MEREIRDEDGTVWTCIQAYAGLGNDPDKVEAAKQTGMSDKLHVVCTPSGGARSVRVALQQGWDTDMSNEALAKAIQMVVRC